MLFIPKEFIIYFFSSVFDFQKQKDFLKIFRKEILSKEIPKSQKNTIHQLISNYKNKEKSFKREDYGAGSRVAEKSITIDLKHLAEHVAIKSKYGKVLYNMVTHFNTKNIIELGTSLGVGSTYLALADKQNTVTTIEGNTEIIEFTKKEIDSLGIQNIQFIHSTFDAVLEDLLKSNSFDLMFIDGNHTLQATLEYFELCKRYKNESSIIIFDDIYWNSEMKKAWHEIRKDKEVKRTIDLFQIGIVFFDTKIKEKENYRLWYGK